MKVQRQELIEAIHEYREKFGRVPKRDEMKDWEGGYSETPYRRVFGTWSEAVQEAGYEPHRPGKYVAEYAQKECAYCGETITRLESQFDESSENYFHESECQDRYHEEHGGGESHPLYNRVTVECSWCGEEKKEKPSVAEEQENFFVIETVTVGGAHAIAQARTTPGGRGAEFIITVRTGEKKGKRSENATTTSVGGVGKQRQSLSKKATRRWRCIITKSQFESFITSLKLTQKRLRIGRILLLTGTE